MHGQDLAAVERQDQILGAAIHAQHLGAGQALNEAVGQGKAQVLAPLLDVLEAAPAQQRLQPGPHSLDFRQFRHD